MLKYLGKNTVKDWNRRFRSLRRHQNISSLVVVESSYVSLRRVGKSVLLSFRWSFSWENTFSGLSTGSKWRARRSMEWCFCRSVRVSVRISVDSVMGAVMIKKSSVVDFFFRSIQIYQKYKREGFMKKLPVYLKLLSGAQLTNLWVDIIL